MHCFALPLPRGRPGRGRPSAQGGALAQASRNATSPSRAALLHTSRASRRAIVCRRCNCCGSWPSRSERRRAGSSRPASSGSSRSHRSSSSRRSSGDSPACRASSTVTCLHRAASMTQPTGRASSGSTRAASGTPARARPRRTTPATRSRCSTTRPTAAASARRVGPHGASRPRPQRDRRLAPHPRLRQLRRDRLVAGLLRRGRDGGRGARAARRGVGGRDHHVRHGRRLRWRSERGVHRQLAAAKGGAERERIVLTTKTFNPMDERRRPRSRARADPAATRGEPRAARRRGVDLYLAHEMDPATPVADTIGMFEQLVAAERSGPSVAATSTPTGSRRRCAHGRAASGCRTPTRCSTARTSGTVLAALRASTGLGYTPFSPLAGGWLTGKYRRGEEAPAGSRMTLRPEPYAHLRDRARLRRARDLRGGGRRAGHARWRRSRSRGCSPTRR